MKFFRWQGLVAFLILGGLAFGFFRFFLDGMIESAIEGEGSKAAQTEIGLAGLSTSLLAQSLAIGGLDVANPDNPGENIVEAEAIRVNLDAVKGLRRKVVIDDMTVEGLRFNQKRPAPAKSFKRPDKKAQTAEPGSPGEAATAAPASGLSVIDRVDIPSPADILKKEPLETLEAAARAQTELERLKTKWEEKLKTELDPAVLEDTRRKIEDLKKKAGKLSDLTQLPAITQEVQSLKAEIEGHIDKVPHLKEELRRDVQEATRLAAELKDLPLKDYQRLKKKYSLDLAGGSNLVGALIGSEVKGYLDRAVRYYRLASPYLNRGGSPREEEVRYERGKGVFVKFPEAEPFPDFLLRHAKLSMNLLDTPIEGELNDLSDNQKVYGKPAALRFFSGKTDRFDNFSLKTRLDRTQAIAKDSLELAAAGVRLKDVRAGEGVTLEEGRVDLKSSIDIVNENEIKGMAAADFGALTLSLPRKEGNEIWNAMAGAIASVDRFSVRVGIAGTLGDYKLDIESDLDEILRKALGQAVSDQLKKFESALRQAIDEKAKGALAGVGGPLAGLQDFGKVLSANESSWKDLLAKAQEGVLPSKKKLPGGLGDLKLPF